eukprot:TRINITY_DN27202_c0_g1_i1.p1 TRINITY_DN27202_c0_g1~~TRINITY_DN27202_c0_g1_i1.p1  ORF type:complete len:396 (+),score=87.33 TRINITY_DN27202_c0_g1_i1:44-1231(+)
MLSRISFLVALGVVATHAGKPWPVVKEELQEFLQGVVTQSSAESNNTMYQVTFLNEMGEPVQAVGGDRQWGVTRALPNDTSLVGSATKMITAAGILKLVENSQLHLEDKVSPILDPYFMMANQSTLLQYCNNDTRVANVTVRHLLHMSSGIPDFDTPGLREWQWTHPNTTNTPIDIMSSLNAKLYFEPGTFLAYSSTNYVLLGFILMVKHGHTDWTDYKQSSVLPVRPGAAYEYTEFCDVGTLSSHDSPLMNVTHGYGPTGRDWYEVSATSGWTCGNALTNTFDLAQWMWDLTHHNIIKKELFDEMMRMELISQFTSYYGLGLMALMPDPYHQTGTGIGHGGDTYGFYAYPMYNTLYNYSLAVTVNRESTDYQANIFSAANIMFAGVSEILKSAE